MPIPHSPTQIFFFHRRQSLSSRKHECLTLPDEGSNIGSSSSRTEQVSVLSRSSISSSSGDITQVHPDHLKGGTMFAAFPVELRVEVFLQFCGIYPAIGKATDGPPLLLRICRAWTELALQTPQLWTSFTLDLRSLPGPKKTAFLISATKRWLDRSRNLPLSFRLHYPVLVDTASTELMQCILASFPRWRDATLHAPTACLLPLLEAKHGSSSCLRTFSLETFGNPSPIVLKGLGINGTQVTELNLSIVPIPTLDECLHILKECVNLRRCSMNAVPLFSSDGLEPLSLQKLEHLQLKIYWRSISHPPSDPFLPFLYSFFLPALRSLRISWNWNTTQALRWSNVSSNRFAEFLEQLSGRLETLHLAYLPLDAGQIIDCLRVVPSLRCFEVSLPQADKEFDFIDHDFLDALTLHSGSSRGHELLPLLQCIRLETNGEAFDDAALLRFIASRWKRQESLSSAAAAGQLESVSIVSPKRRAEYHLRRFKDWKEGMLEAVVGLRSEFTTTPVFT